MRDYFAIVDERESPESKGQKRQDKILSLTFAGDDTALAHVECAIPPKKVQRFFELYLCRWTLANYFKGISFHY